MRRNVTATMVVMALLLLALPAAPARAQDAPADGPSVDTVRGVRAAGMGEAYTGHATGTGALYHNPAGIARSVMYSLEAMFEYTPNGSMVNAAIVDSSTNPMIAAGVAYTYFFGRGELSGVSNHDIRLSLGIPIVQDQVSVGIGGRYLILRDSSGDESRELMRGITFDAGVIFRLADLLHLGVSAQNLLEPECNDSRCRGVAPTTFNFGAAVGRETAFMLTGDVGVDVGSLEDDTALNFGVGAEYLVSGAVPIRVGFMRRGALEHNFLTAGLGWRSPSAGADVSYQHDLSRSDELGYIAGSVSLFF